MILGCGGVPIEGATVTLRDEADENDIDSGVTDAQGKVTLQFLETGNYTIKVEVLKDCYGTLVEPIELVECDPSPLEPIEIQMELGAGGGIPETLYLSGTGITGTVTMTYDAVNDYWVGCQTYSGFYGNRDFINCGSVAGTSGDMYILKFDHDACTTQLIHYWPMCALGVRGLLRSGWSCGDMAMHQIGTFAGSYTDFRSFLDSGYDCDPFETGFTGGISGPNYLITG